MWLYSGIVFYRSQSFYNPADILIFYFLHSLQAVYIAISLLVNWARASIPASKHSCKVWSTDWFKKLASSIYYWLVYSWLSWECGLLLFNGIVLRCVGGFDLFFLLIYKNLLFANVSALVMQSYLYSFCVVYFYLFVKLILFIHS